MPNNLDRLQLRQTRMEQSPAILRGGFRPFFIGAATWAICALAVWLLILFGFTPSQFLEDPLAWHRHEMLFGFVGAAIAGFALTAVPNWTGRLPIAGAPLGALFGVWMAGRILPFLVSHESVLLIVLDPGFYVVLAALLAREILKSRNRNFPIVAVIGLFGIADLVDRVAMAGLADIANIGWQIGFALVIFLLAIIGGRIVPSFTRNWLVAQGAAEPLPTQPDYLDKAVLVLTALALLSWLIWPASLPTGVVVMAAAIAHVFRLVRWQGWRCRSNALLIILHVGYLWLPMGLLLLASAQWALVSETAAIHALATGAMATMILAVMSRASLGHTGRELSASRQMILSYVLISLAAVMRVSAAIGIGVQQITLTVAALAWAGAFGLFLVQFVPILTSGPIQKKVGKKAVTSCQRAIWLLIIATSALTTLLILSFVATPVKFLAEDVPLEQLLAVGRVTFRASLVCETAFVASLMLIARGRARWLVLAASALLLIQWLFLMPLLDDRTFARMAGHQLTPSSLHLWWVVFDVTRIAVYWLLIRSAVRTITMTVRADSLAS